MVSETYVIEARRLSKHYGGVLAVNEINLGIRAGEVLAIVGDNGAGKSTFVKMLCGVVQPDAGDIIHRGERVEFASPHHARMRGIEAIYQDLALAPGLDIAGNLYVGREIVYPFLPRPISIMNYRAMARGAKEKLKDLAIDLPVVSGLPVTNLSGGQRQAVAVARAAAWATEVLFMDEPTAALGVKQSAATLNIAKRLAQRGVAVVIITHTLPHVMQFADRIVVLRHGRKIADMPRTEATQERIVSLIVGFDSGNVDDGSSHTNPSSRI